MPILYQQNKQTMVKQINEMSQQEAQDYLMINSLPVMNGYTTQQANIMVKLVKTFIDPFQRDCAHCGTAGGLRQAKDKFILYFKSNEEAIKQIAETGSLAVTAPIESVTKEAVEEKPKKKSTYKSKKK